VEIMSEVFQVPLIAGRGAPVAKAGVMAGLGKAALFTIPTILVGAAVAYGLSKAFDIRWDEFSRRAADGDSTLDG
jgi:hypothetical protein